MLINKSFCAFVVLLLSVSGAAAQVVLSSQSLELCKKGEVQAVCNSSCASACEDAEFLSNNAAFCISTGILYGKSTQKRDDANCVTILPVGTDNAVKPRVATSGGGQMNGDTVAVGATPAETNAGTTSECGGLETQFKRRRCELAKVTPACAPTVTDLIGKSRLLVTQIELELEKYGDLLQRDWTDVSNRALLCGFSEVSLEDSYNLASENPEGLRALQRQATGVQGCQAEWETWVRDNAGNRSSDALIDSVTRDAEAQLVPLKGQIEGLSTSVSKLENAAETIGEIIDVHIIFCDPNGTPVPPPPTGTP